MRHVDTQQYVGLLRELIEEGKEVTFLVTGNSMSPFLIHERDTVFLRKPGRLLNRGDIVFYRRESGQYILHRIVHVNSDGSYDMIGDNQTEIEKQVRRDQVFALVCRVRRKGKILTAETFWWKFFAGPWLDLIPLRHVIVKMYSMVRKQVKDGSEKSV